MCVVSGGVFMQSTHVHACVNGVSVCRVCLCVVCVFVSCVSMCVCVSCVSTCVCVCLSVCGRVHAYRESVGQQPLAQLTRPGALREEVEEDRRDVAQRAAEEEAHGVEERILGARAVCAGECVCAR